MKPQRWHVIEQRTDQGTVLLVVTPTTPGAFEVEALAHPIAGPDTEQPADALRLRPLDPP